MKIIPIASIGSALPVSGKEILVSGSPTKENQRLKSVLRLTGRFSTEVLRWASYSAVLGSALLFTTPGNKLLHNIGQSRFHLPIVNRDILGLIPKPQARLIHHEIDGYKCDSFFSNQKEFSKIESVIKKLHLNPKDIDTNNDGIILNSRADTQKLHDVLLSFATSPTNDTNLKDEIKDALLALATLNTHDQIIFGKDGIDPETFNQGGIPNCQILAALKGLSYTPENIQTLRSIIKVTGYDYESSNPYLNAEVNIDGKTIPIEYPKLVKWMSPMYYSPSHANDGSLALPILAAAIEEAGNSYDTVPHAAESTSPILITGKDYYVISTWSLNDDDIRAMLSLAPRELVTVGSFPEDPSLKGLALTLIDGAKEKLTHTSSPPVLSEQKAIAFQESMNTRVQEITSTENTPQNIPQNIRLNISTPNLSNNKSQPINSLALTRTSQQDSTEITKPVIDIVPHHEYAIKSYSHKDGKDTIILTDSHGVEYKPLTLKEFREKIIVLVVGKEHTPLIPGRSLFIMSILAIIGTLTRVGANKANKLINPEYENWMARLKNRLISAKTVNPT